jgi:hypothetical protein
MQLLLQDKILVTINGEIAKDDFPSHFLKSIEQITQIKNKGSHPTKINYIYIYMNDKIIMKYILRQDSRDPDMYWFSATSPKYQIDLGFIKLDENLLDGGNL